MRGFRRFLAEAFISPNKGANYGQIIFLVGGAGSGKSTAIRNLIDASKYKTVNPDDVKRLMQKAAKAGFKGYEELKGVDPNTPEGSQIMHALMLNKRLSSKMTKKLFSLDKRSPDLLPNLLFDRTFSYAGEIEKFSKRLYGAGYKPENMHIVFVYTDVDVAIQQNKNRARTLPDEVIIRSAQGAKKNFMDLVFARLKGAAVNGEYYMIMRDRYLKIKESGKRLDRAGEIARKLGIILRRR